MAAPSYEFAVIGSGVSGARIAYELVKAGKRVVLIEAGRRFDRQTFPRGEMAYSTQMFWGGGIEISRDGRLGFLRAKCLGGTSVVNQADFDRFDELAWSDWRSRTGIDYFGVESMAGYYDRVLETTACTTIPDRFHNRNARLFSQAFDHKGYHWQPLERAQSDCAFEHGSDCIVCLGGCPRDSKQSALVTVIPRAIEMGLAIETGLEVQYLVTSNNQASIYASGLDGPREIVAERVVLAAGALGNTSILMRSPEIARNLPALGKGFACHPQFMTYGYFDEPVDAHKGPLQAVQSHDDRLRSAGLKLENVYAPPIATAMLIPGLGKAHQHQMRRYRNLASIEVAIRDEPLGSVHLARGGKLVIDKPLSTLDREKIRRGLEIVCEMFGAIGAREVVRCEQAFGLHLMGGCALGSDPRRAVVDPNFQVFGQPRLFAADSSTFPSAPGINPSFSILALSIRAAECMLAA